MSTKQLTHNTNFQTTGRPAWLVSLGAEVRELWLALREGKAAADHYQSLVAQGTMPQEASQTVFRRHFGRR